MEQLTEQQLQDCNNAGLGVALRMAMHQPVLAVGGEGRAIMAAAAQRLMELGDIRVIAELDGGTITRRLQMADFPGENQAYEAMHDAQTEASVYKRQLETAQANYDSLNADLLEKDEANRELAAQVNDLTRKLAETESNARAAQQRLVDQVDSLKPKLEQTKAELFREKRDTERLKSALTEANAEVADSDRALKLARADLQRRVEVEREDGARWFWQTDGNNYLDGLVDNVQVIIGAKELRDLLASKREADGITVKYDGDTHEGHYANYSVKMGDDGRHGCAIQVLRRRQDGQEFTWFAAIERRLLANAPAEPEEKPAQLPLTVICDVERLCIKLAGDMSVTPPAHGVAWRNGKGDQPKVWRLACSLYQDITGIDAWQVAMDYDEIPF